MGSLTKAFKTDENKERDGVWVDIIENEDGSTARMKVRRMGLQNKKFMKYVSQNRRGRVASKVDEVKANIKAFVKTCLMDWENIENIRAAPPGQPKSEYMPFTEDNALLLFTEIPDLYELVVEQANDISLFKEQENEETAKN